MDKNDWNNTLVSYGDIYLDWIAIWMSDKTFKKLKTKYVLKTMIMAYLFVGINAYKNR